MFMKTMAVGPLEPVESCVTGGMTVAMLLLLRYEMGGAPGSVTFGDCFIRLENAERAREAAMLESFGRL
jgi:hypothetical protein